MKRVSKSALSIIIAVLLLMFSSVSVFAAESPSATPEINVTIEPSLGGVGGYTFESNIGAGENGGTIVHFTTTPNDGYEFDHWKIDGKYTILQGSLNSSNLVVEAFTDLDATPYFKTAGGSGNSSSSGGTSAGSSVNVPIDSNTSGTSPQTGDNSLLLFAGAVVILAACGAFAVKRKIDKIEK